MAGNPGVVQGTLNRLRGSVLWSGFPQLNVTAPFLAKAGIRLAFQGKSVVYIDTLTGAVSSPEPYLHVSVSMALLKTQALADAYKDQWELLATLGDGVVRSDSKAMKPWQITNMSISEVGELTFNGEEVIYPVVCEGFYVINSALWDL